MTTHRTEIDVLGPVDIASIPETSLWRRAFRRCWKLRHEVREIYASAEELLAGVTAERIRGRDYDERNELICEYEGYNFVDATRKWGVADVFEVCMSRMWKNSRRGEAVSDEYYRIGSAEVDHFLDAHSELPGVVVQGWSNRLELASYTRDSHAVVVVLTGAQAIALGAELGRRARRKKGARQ